MEVFAIICSILAALSAICAILAFVDRKKKDITKEGGNRSTLEFDVKYVRNAVDNMQLEIKSISNEQNKSNIISARQDERLSNIEKRVDTIETQLEEWRK